MKLKSGDDWRERVTKLWSDQLRCMVQRPGWQQGERSTTRSKWDEDAEMDVQSDKEG